MADLLQSFLNLYAVFTGTILHKYNFRRITRTDHWPTILRINPRARLSPSAASWIFTHHLGR